LPGSDAELDAPNRCSYINRVDDFFVQARRECRKSELWFLSRDGSSLKLVFEAERRA